MVNGCNEGNGNHSFIERGDGYEVAFVIPEGERVLGVAEDPAANIVLGLLDPGRPRVPVPAREGSKLVCVGLAAGEGPLELHLDRRWRESFLRYLLGVAPALEDLGGVLSRIALEP